MNVYKPKPEEIPSGDCECGCGGRTAIARITKSWKRHFRGHPVPYLPGHFKAKRGNESHKWKGGKTNNYGYVLIYMPDHPQARADGYVLEHRVVMERKLGRLLGADEDVHHINGIQSDNREENLVVLTKTEHHRLHIQHTNSVMTSEKYAANGRKAWSKTTRKPRA